MSQVGVIPSGKGNMAVVRLTTVRLNQPALAMVYANLRPVIKWLPPAPTGAPIQSRSSGGVVVMPPGLMGVGVGLIPTGFPTATGSISNRALIPASGTAGTPY